MTDLKDKYPDTFVLIGDNLDKVDTLLEEVQAKLRPKFEDQLHQFSRVFDEDMRTAFIIRLLESNGMTVGLPDNDVLNSMFQIIEDTACLVFHHIQSEDIRI